MRQTDGRLSPFFCSSPRLSYVLVKLELGVFRLDFDRSLQPFPVAVELLPMLQDPLLTEEWPGGRGRMSHAIQAVPATGM